MYELTVERTFCAAHAIVMRGLRESVHGHNWQTTICVKGDQLDEDGLLCDFHELESAVDAAIAPFKDRNLNETPPFDRINPTAENVAREIARSLMDRIPAGATLHSVAVTEAPGCRATYVVDRDHGSP